MRLVVKTYKYKLYNSKKNRYLVRQIELEDELRQDALSVFDEYDIDAEEV